MFAVGDMYGRLKSFKSRHIKKNPQFYLAKVDVQAAFDSIPQAAVVELMKKIPSHGAYNIAKHVEISGIGFWTRNRSSDVNVKPWKKWQSLAKATKDKAPFIQRLEHLASDRSNTVFLDSAYETSYDTSDLMDLMGMHVQDNLVRIGKKYFRQKDGIPQGSVLSSVLCNYFYADLEKRHLEFLASDDCLLLRLIDDFLLITLDMSKAERFTRILLKGLPEYGVVVNPQKTLVNFDLVVRGTKLPRLASDERFPFCGKTIDCRTLEISKDRQAEWVSSTSDSLTVEYSRTVGRTFQRKTLNAFTIQAHLMYFDTGHNSEQASLGNLYSAYVETATKMSAYARCLPTSKQPSAKLVIGSLTKPSQWNRTSS